ncbi:MAG TPA: MFS transporter [Prosthecobacter sp.]|nr:MFS transporter [Prosthecobacter sp.]
MPDEKPTHVRHSVLAITTMVAFMMYLDRICLAWIVDSKSFKGDINLTPSELSWVKGVFFWAYAAAQVPAGWLSDRFGARILMTTYIVLWSLCTIATSLSAGVVTLVIARICCGLAEAGAYPASSSILTKWAHINWRGVGSSIISSGGRIGGALAPWLTASVIIATLANWRWVGWIYGVVGIAVAVVFWVVFRDHPKLHPKVNQAELDLLSEGRGDFSPVREPPRRFPWRAALTSRNLWFASLYQTATNVGWAFLVNSLSVYLAEVKHLDDKVNGQVSSIALTIGIIGLPLGGMLTDYWSKKYGVRAGRLLPLVVTRCVAVAAYFAAMAADTPLELAIGFGLLAIFVDMGMPAMWTLMQDISGRHQAQLFGWANMWGNFGAGLQPILVAWILLHYDANKDYQEPMLFSAAALLLSIFLAFGIDASKPVVKEEVV